jgi:hypothetical protein
MSKAIEEIVVHAKDGGWKKNSNEGNGTIAKSSADDAGKI